MRREVELAYAELVELFRRGAAPFHLFELARELVREDAHGMPRRAPRDDRRAIARLQDELLVVFVRDTLLRQDEARAHLHAPCAEGERRRHAARITDAARRDDRNIDGVDDLRHERHRRDLADVTARLRSLSNERVNPRPDEAFGKRDGSDDGDDLAADLLERRDVLAGVARSRRHDGHAFIDDDLHDLLDEGRHEHDVDAERLLGPALALLNFRAQDVGRHVSGADDAKPPGVRDGRSKLRRADPSHASLEDWILYPQHLTNTIFFKHP